jgi:hypothetical protein
MEICFHGPFVEIIQSHMKSLGMCEDQSWNEGGELQIYMIVMLRGNVMDITTCHILGDRHIPLHKV